MSSGRITLLPELGVKAMQLFVKHSKIRMGELVSLIHCSAAPWGLSAIRAGMQGREGSWVFV